MFRATTDGFNARQRHSGRALCASQPAEPEPDPARGGVAGAMRRYSGSGVVPRMAVVSRGNDGVVVRFRESPVARRPDLVVVKFYHAFVRYDDALHQSLARADPSGRYFAQYVRTDARNLGLAPHEQATVLAAMNGPMKPFVTLSPLYAALPDPRRLTKAQYRHLRAAVELLTRLGISHNDLPGNVMLHPRTNLPVIIDFAQATREGPAQADLLAFQMQSFISNFAKGA